MSEAPGLRAAVVEARDTWRKATPQYDNQGNISRLTGWTVTPEQAKQLDHLFDVAVGEARRHDLTSAGGPPDA